MALGISVALCNWRLYRLLVMFREMQQSFWEASAFLESFPSGRKRYTGDKDKTHEEHRRSIEIVN